MVGSGRVPPPLPLSTPFSRFALKSFISVGPFTAGAPPRMSERRGDCACLLGRTTVRVCANAGMPDKQNKIKTAMFNKFLRYGTTPAEIFRSCICMRLRSKTIFRRGVISRCFQKPRRHRRLAFRHKERPSANRANVVAPVWSTRAGTFDRADMSERALKGPFRHTAVAAVYQDVDELRWC